MLIISRDFLRFTLFAKTTSSEESATYSYLPGAMRGVARYVLAMLTLISCRESNTNANRFGPHVISSGESSFDGGPLSQPILIHGHNCTEDQVVQDYTPFSAALKRNCIAYSWPGGCHPLDFTAAADRANLAGYRLRDVFFMRRLRTSTENVVAHSLGARVALTALACGSLRLNKLVLLGPAVDWNVFERGAEFEHIPTCCESVHVLYSNLDEMLKLAFPIDSIQADVRALGLDGPCDPLVIPKNVVLHDVSTLVATHGAYLRDPQCSELVRQILGD